MLSTESGGLKLFWKKGMKISTENKNKNNIRYKNNITFRLCWYPWTGSQADFHGSWCCKRLCWYPWYMLLLDAMLMSMVCAAIRGHADVPDLCCLESTGWCLCSQLPTERMLKSKIHPCYYMLLLAPRARESCFQVIYVTKGSYWRWET